MPGVTNGGGGGVMGPTGGGWEGPTKIARDCPVTMALPPPEFNRWQPQRQQQQPVVRQVILSGGNDGGIDSGLGRKQLRR